jgi:hypothetical protein
MVMIDIFILAKKLHCGNNSFWNFSGKNLIINSRKFATNLEKFWQNFKTTKLNKIWSCDI